MSRRQIGNIARVTISVVGIVVLLFLVDVRAAVSALRTINPVGFWGALALFQAGIIVRAARWWSLLRPHTTALPLWKLVRLYYIGMFFNLFLPTGFGGDVVRAAELGGEVDGTVSAATVLLDRVVGLMALFALALLAAPFAVGAVPGELLAVGLGVSVVGLVGGGMALQGGLLRAMLAWLRARLYPIKLADRVLGALVKFNEAVAAVGADRAALTWAFAYSTAFNVMLVLMHILLSWALALDVPATAYFTIVPLTSILLLVPSIQGLGVRDLSLVAMISLFTDDLSGAAALSAAIILQNLMSGLVGLGVYGVYIGTRPPAKKKKSDDRAAEA